tara:strand:- start:1740 stop:1952 length:213 start_codon:yes stop_codon:yes gene_type:complete
MNIQLNYDQILTVTLPDGQTVEIDARTRAETDIYINNPHGDCYESLSFKEWQDDEPHPSLSAAERNTNLR